MAGRDAGYDISSREGVRAWMDRISDSAPLPAAAQKTAAEKRAKKAQRKAQRSARKKNR